jgi:hypothetical protein
VTQAPKQFFGRGVKVDHLTSVAQMYPVGRPQDNTTARRQHSVGALRKLIDYRLFNISKPVFTFTFKILTYRTTQLLLDNMVRVKKWELKPSGELAPDSRFT